MYFYEVFVSSQRYHGSEPLTYSSQQQLSAGAIVSVLLGRQSVVGFVLREVKKPAFATKDILSTIDSTVLPEPLVNLHSWIQTYYPGPSGILTQLFLPSSIDTASRRKKTQQAAVELLEQPPLTSEQEKAVADIQSGTSSSYLLHGETGSGKTRVYIELSKKILGSGKSVLILTPEIGLTPQLTSRLERSLPGKITVLHSNQTIAERRDNWKAIAANTEPQVIVGPRSALFAPVTSLGLIIIDECHDAAYKQDQMPYYQTSRVAGKLTALHGAKLVLGSATPSVSDYFTFESKSLPIIRMTESARGTRDITTTVVDLKDRQKFSRSPWLSDTLILDIESALQSGYQSLVFLNRRGTARIIVCGSCGWQAICPRCDLPLTYHGDKHRLQCHTCGFSERTPLACPECKKPEVQFKSIGTKTLIQEVERLFPEARTARFDSDNTKAESMDTQFESILHGEIDILVGTQVLSKGLDLPLLQVIGVVLADTGLYFPDYSAEERTFQMLHQVIGRVGRGHIAGKVTLQSYNPDSAPIKAAIARDYRAFYESQLSERHSYRFPPYYFVLKVSIERAIQTNARSSAHDLARALLESGLAIEVTGPSPAFIEKAKNKYRWQIIVKAKQRQELVKAIRMLPKNCSYDIDPTNLL